MKNKNLLVALAKLLKIDQQVIETELEKENGDDSIVKTYTDKHQAYTVEELGTLMKNREKQFLEKADFDINDVPKGLYNKIAAAAFESKEKALAKEHGIEKYDNLQDLLNKVVVSKTGKGVDEQTREQIATLKGTIKDLEKKLVDDVNAERIKYDSEFVSRDLTSALAGIALDYEAEAVEKQKKLLNSAFSNEYKVSRKDGKTIVLDKEGKPKMNKLGEPEALSDVMKTFATDMGFKIKAEDQGGRGAGSSEGPPPNVYKGKTFEEVAKAKGVKPMTAESDALYKEWDAQNKK